MQDAVMCAHQSVRPPTPEILSEQDDEPPSCMATAASNNTQPNIISDLVTPFLSAVPAGRRVARTSQQTILFRRKHYKGISDKTWNDWHWQVSHQIRSEDQIEAMIDLTTEERFALTEHSGRLPVAITPYYMSLIAGRNSQDPLRRTMIPTIHEFNQMSGEADDPLSEEEMSPVPGLVHRYPDRVLLLVHDFCAAYCRYCTRSRVVGRGVLLASRKRLERAIDYIRSTSGIRDVLVSGGDPMLLSDDRLSWLLGSLRQIPHVEIIRIGTKVPAVLPQRITPQLARKLRRYHPLWMSLHFTHPNECTPEAYRACRLLADVGIPLGSQTVLLRGINDSVDTITQLVHNLLRMRVRPYYLYQCDPISGSSHFRTPVAKGVEIMRGLRGFTSGYAIPTYVIDAPGGGGKIPVNPEYTCGCDGSDLILRNYEGKVFRYPDLYGAAVSSL
jgi:lysine 2,3-aminomutase